MRVYNKIGSKERLIEMFNNVNKTRLNEDIGSNESILLLNYKQLISNSLNIRKTQTRVSDNETFVIINAINDNNNEIMFVFNIVLDEKNQDGVYGVSDASLVEFKIGDDSIGDDVIELFNKEHGSTVYNTIKQYIDVDDSDEISDLIMGDDSVNEEIDSIETDNNQPSLENNILGFNNNILNEDDLNKLDDYLNKDYTSLSDNDKEEYFDLWNKFKSIDNINERELYATKKKTGLI